MGGLKADRLAWVRSDLSSVNLGRAADDWEIIRAHASRQAPVMSPRLPPSMLPFLTRLKMHSQLNDDESQAILALPYFPIQVPTNRDFVQYREEVTHSCFVLDGMVGTFGQNKRGERQITSFFLTGDMVDLHTV